MLLNVSNSSQLSHSLPDLQLLPTPTRRQRRSFDFSTLTKLQNQSYMPPLNSSNTVRPHQAFHIKILGVIIFIPEAPFAILLGQY